ncbi:unnamed protein product [Fusarium graminearum]|nr:unnamed protein product [Fusarium graminearum]
METLLGVRLYMRQQQAMIVEAVSVLSRDPGIVHRRDGWATTRLTTSLSRFMTQATGHDTSMAAAKVHHKAAVEKPLTSPEFSFDALIPADLWKKWLPVSKSVSASAHDELDEKPEERPFSGVSPPPSDDSNWGSSSQARKSGNRKGDNHAAVLQRRVDDLASDLQRKTKEHTDLVDKLKSDHQGQIESKAAEHAMTLQNALDKLTADNNAELSNLRKTHSEETAALNHRLSGYKDLEEGGKSEIDKTFKRLTKEKEDAMSAVNHELETLKKDFKSLEEETKVKNAEIIKVKKEKQDELSELGRNKDAEIIRVQKEKQDELSALWKDKDATYKALEDLYKSLKESSGTLTKDNAALTTQNGSLTTKLQDKNSAYTSLTRERDALKTESEATAVKYTALMTKWNDLDGINDTLKTKMRWAGLTEKSRQDNCLSNGYSGWCVMIMMPHSWIALNANKDSHEMAHTWSFNMRNPDEIFRLQKADDDPNTPWTITSTECGKALAFDTSQIGIDIRMRKLDQVRDRSAQWYIGRGAEGQHTWVFKNAQWGTCIKLKKGWSEDGRAAEQHPYCNEGDSNFAIIPLGLKPKPEW